MKKRYWLVWGRRGGVWGLLYSGLWAVFSLEGNRSPEVVLGEIVEGTVIFTITSIGIGAFTGWLYGKIKNRNKIIN